MNRATAEWADYTGTSKPARPTTSSSSASQRGLRKMEKHHPFQIEAIKNDTRENMRLSGCFP